MQIAVKVNLDEVSPVLVKLASTAQRKAELNEHMGLRVQEKTRDHLTAYGASHPNKLGGKRTNYWARAAQDVASPEALEISEARALLNLGTPGLSRAFGPVTIVPGTKTAGAKYLAIPARAESYGFKPRELDNLVLFWTGKGKPGGLAEGVPVQRTKNTNRGAKGSTYLAPGLVMFWFAESAVQEQDRSLLPSDAEWLQEASKGAADFVDRVLHEAKGGPP